MENINDTLIAKYIDILDTNLVVVCWDETDEIIRIWVARKRLNLVCPYCGRIFRNSVNSEVHYVIEDIPIYGKRVQVILSDRVYYSICECGHKYEADSVFLKFEKIYTTGRYQEYVKINCGPFTHKLRFVNSLCEKYSKFKIWDLWNMTLAYREDNINLFYMYRDFLVVINSLKARYKNNRELASLELKRITYRLITRFLDGENILVSEMNKRKGSFRLNNSRIGKIYNSFLKNDGDVDKTLNDVGGDKKSFAITLDQVKTYIKLFQFIEETEMDSDGMYVIPSLLYLQDGYDSYMESVNKHEVELDSWKSSVDETDLDIIRSLEGIGYKTVHFAEEGEIRALVLCGNNFSKLHNYEGCSKILKLKSYTRVLNIGERTYGLKVIPESVVYTEGNKESIMYNSINCVIKHGNEYVWGVKERLQKIDGHDYEYGYYNEYATEHKVNRDMLWMWIFRISPEFTYIKHEENDGKITVFVQCIDNAQKCVKCGSDELEKLQTKTKIEGLKFNGHEVEIVVLNHTLYRCTKDGIVFQRKYNINTNMV